MVTLVLSVRPVSPVIVQRLDSVDIQARLDSQVILVLADIVQIQDSQDTLHLLASLDIHRPDILVCVDVLQPYPRRPP